MEEGSKLLEKYRNDWYKIDVLNKPIKALSFYKLQELVDFCNKLNLDIINKETNKPKKKQELYEAVLQNLS
jgi:threonyl-tRNA synthetase